MLSNTSEKSIPLDLERVLSNDTVTGGLAHKLRCDGNGRLL